MIYKKTAGGAASSGASTALDNLTNPTSVNQSLIPSSDGSKSLGSIDSAFAYCYTRRLNSSNGEIDVYVDFVPVTTATQQLGNSTHKWAGVWGTFANIAAASAPPSVEGNIYWDTVSHSLKVYDGTGWKTVTVT